MLIIFVMKNFKIKVTNFEILKKFFPNIFEEIELSNNDCSISFQDSI